MTDARTCPQCRSKVVPIRSPKGILICPACENTGVIVQDAFSQSAAQSRPYVQPAYPAQSGFAAPPSAPGAIASMVLGILSLVMPYIGWIMGIIAMVLGKKALDATQLQPGQFSGQGMAKAGKIMGLISIILHAIGFIFLMLAVLLVLVSEPSSG